MSAIFAILATVIEIYVVIMIVYAFSSWIPAQSGSAFTHVVRVLAMLCEPVLRPMRRVIPPVRAGGMAIDLSVLIFVVVAELVVIPILKA